MSLSSIVLPFGSANAPPAIRQIERRYARFMPLVIALGLLASAFEGVGIGMLIPMLSVIGQRSGVGEGSTWMRQFADLAVSVYPSRPLLFVSAVMLCLALARASIQVANAVLMAKLEGCAGRDIRDALAERVINIDYQFFLESDSSRLVTIIDTDSWKATEAFRLILMIATAVSAVIMFAILLIMVDWRLCLLVSFGVAVSRIVQVLLSRRLKRFGSAVVRANHVLGEKMIQIVVAIRAIKLFGQEARELGQFRANSEAVRRTMLASDTAAAWSMPTIELVVLVIILAVLLTADAWHVGLPTLIAFLVLLYRLQSPLLTVNHLTLRLASLRGSIEEVEWLLSMTPQRASRMRPVAVPDFSRAIYFENVGFAYAGKSDAPAVKNVTLALEPATMTALVGRSGSGKSTLVNLLCRLIEPASGRILLGDTDIATFDPAEWRRHIALAGQDLELINGTVAENIAYGSDCASHAEIERAARMSEAHEFVCMLPQGYDTCLGASGFGLSGGQRQRIGLARALLRRPEILILDEATSAVDGVSEDIIFRLLHEERAFGRAIIISHRLETIRACDAGIEMLDGRVQFQGKLQETTWFQDAWTRQKGLFG
ncbi:ABC transporter ATP-binding protein [Methylobacterium sp. P31]